MSNIKENDDDGQAKRSWRDVIKIHPAADVFPMLPQDELRKLGEDIKKNGLTESIVIWRDWRAGEDAEPEPTLLDGRNRLDAMELVGMEVVSAAGEFNRDIVSELFGVDDPIAYAISANIRRRHLTKEQQAELIVKVMAAGTDFAKVARSVQRNSNGRVQGSTKDPVKEKIVQEAKQHGISKRTAENALAKHRGPTQAKREKKPPNQTNKDYPAREKVPTEPVKNAVQPKVNVDEPIPEPAIPAAMTVKGAINVIAPFIDKVLERIKDLKDRYAVAVEIRKWGYKLEEQHRPANKK